MNKVFSPKKARKRQDPERVRGWNQKHFAGKKSVHLQTESLEKFRTIRDDCFPNLTLCDALSALIDGLTIRQTIEAIDNGIRK